MNKIYSTHQFKAFDTKVFIGMIAEEKNTKIIIKRIEEAAEKFERRFSRFNPISELNRLNNANGKKIKVSEEMIDLIVKSKTAYKKTKGVFDPTILASLQEIGYNKSFNAEANEESNEEKKEIESQSFTDQIKSNFKKRPRFETLKLDKNTVVAPKNFKMDLGGIAKGYWVDKIAKILEKNCKSFWISAGGDIYLKGKQENGNPWEVGVQNPKILDEVLLSLRTPEKGIGIATSGIVKRRGMKNGIKWHHLINSKTGFPVKNSILSVTAIANSTIEADVMAKTALILGIKKGLALMNHTQNQNCIIIDENLKIHASKGMNKLINTTV